MSDVDRLEIAIRQVIDNDPVSRMEERDYLEITSQALDLIVEGVNMRLEELDQEDEDEDYDGIQ